MIEAGQSVSGAVLRRHEIVRTELWHSLAAIHERFDALLCPTEALPVPLATQTDADFYFDRPDGRYYGVAMTMPFNLTAQCPVIYRPASPRAVCPPACRWSGGALTTPESSTWPPATSGRAPGSGVGHPSRRLAQTPP